MRLLMLGWEYPPQMTGGLGIACRGLVRGLLEWGHQVVFVMPGTGLERAEGCFELRFAGSQTWVEYSAYVHARTSAPRSVATTAVYAFDLLGEVSNYAGQAVALAAEEDFACVHAHDWMTYPAAAAIRERTGRPFVAHVHSIEADRAGDGGDYRILAYESEGLRRADRVIAVSHYTKNRIQDVYGISADRVRVVHNAVDEIQPTRQADEKCPLSESASAARPARQVVLFLGRLAGQKGPEFFVRAAQRVVEHDPDVLFVIAGSGDMAPYLIEETARLGITENVVFTGNVDHDDVRHLFAMADVFVLTSRSEPYGLSVAEAMQWGVPCIVSKYAGVTEVSPHCLRVDFWDVEALADRIHAVLHAPASLGYEMALRASASIRCYTWRDAAGRLLEVYRELLPNVS